jgi:Helix-turn-helix
VEPARPEPSRRARETPRLLKLQQRPDGYQAVFLTGDDGVRKCIKVHRLVLFAWVGEPPEDQVYGRWEASHMSGVRNDNRLDNVAWEPPKLNFRRQTPHDRRANSYRRGEQNHNAKLTAEKAQAIRERYAAGGVTQYQLADEYGVSQSAIGAMLNGRTWKQPGEAA